MASEMKRKFARRAVISIVGVVPAVLLGLWLQVHTLRYVLPAWWPRWWPLIVGSVLFGYGIACWARDKGRSMAWGVVGFFVIPAIIFLVFVLGQATRP
jgi:hypothetical protein